MRLRRFGLIVLLILTVMLVALAFVILMMQPFISRSIVRYSSMYPFRTGFSPVLTGSIDAVQLNYSVDDAVYFSAREPYAWISRWRGGADPPFSGERVAGHPLNRPLNDPLAPDNKTYAYRICADTFASDETEQNEWIDLIEHALEQWELASDGLVMMDHALDENGNRAPCVRYQDYAGPVLQWLRANTSGLLGDEVEINITTVSEFINTLSYVGDFDREDRERNEIVMVDIDLQRLTGFTGGELWEFSNDLNLSDCIFTSTSCTFTRFVGADVLGVYIKPIPHVTTRLTTDIMLRSDRRLDPRVIPTVTFNACSSPYSKAYEDLVHEAGHALGIGAGDWSPKDLDPDTIEAYMDDHPPLVESVMNYNEHSKRLLLDDSTTDYKGEPDCSPHPMDIMAIYSLYQTVD